MRAQTEDELKVLAFVEMMHEMYAAARPSVLNPGAKPFVEYAWKPFLPREVLRVLLAPEDSYFAHKEMLFSGFCTWVVCPTLPRMAKFSVLLTAIHHLARAEKNGRKQFPRNPLLADVKGRFLIPGRDFYEDFWHPMGGLKSIWRSPSPGNFKASILVRSHGMPTIVALVQILHFHAEHIRCQNRYFPVSLKKSGELVQSIHRERRDDKGHPRKSEGGVSSRDAERRWRSLGHAAALVYAASTIEVEAGTTLLSVMRSGEATYETHGEHLTTWVGRARYAADAIIAYLPTAEPAVSNADVLPNVQALTIPEPSFTSQEAQRIREHFRR